MSTRSTPAREQAFYNELCSDDSRGILPGVRPAGLWEVNLLTPYYSHLTLLFMPIAILPGVGWLIKLVALVDALLLGVFPQLGNRAWMVVINFEKNGGVPD